MTALTAATAAAAPPTSVAGMLYELGRTLRRSVGRGTPAPPSPERAIRFQDSPEWRRLLWF